VPFCTEPPLGVEYTNVETYSGTVSCGNLFLESDIGGGINEPPQIKYTKAKQGKYYTLLMLDTDALNSGSWPEETKSGDHAPVRHWAIGNLDRKMLTSGDTTGADTISSFVGPSPPQGSHRYGQYLFEQEGFNKYIKYPAGNITNWDYGSFVYNHSLGFPVSANWHITQHADPHQ